MSPTRRTKSDEAPTEESVDDTADHEPTRQAPRPGWYVPRWVAGVVVLALALGAGFGIGRWTDDGHGGPGRPGIGLPGRFGNGGQGGRQVGPNGNPRVLPGQGGQLPSQSPSQGSQTQSDAFLGVSVQDATGTPQGAQVMSVAAGSPAASAGFKAGDVITALDGNVTNASQLANRIALHSSGDQVTITYNRGGTSTDVKVTLGSRSSSSAA